MNHLHNTTSQAALQVILQLSPVEEREFWGLEGNNTKIRKR